MLARLSPTQLLRYAGLFTYACVGIPLALNPWYFGEEGLSDNHLLGWRMAYLVFGICYWQLTRTLGHRARRPLDLWLLLTLTLSAAAVTYFSQSGLGGILLMIVAGILPWFLPVVMGVAWLVLQHLTLIPVFVSQPELGFGWIEAVLQAAFYIGYSSFTFITSLVAKGQAQARDEQRRLNAELRATRALLAESTRLNERMRIARELHDLLGHHLTALSLNLEVASHLSQGRSQEHVRQAHLLAKLLLTDVREAVSQLRDQEAIDLSLALRSLIEGVPALEVHLDIPDGFRIEDPRRAQVLLRCAQEIITNTVRHSGASTLWLALRREAGEFGLRARDNGRGAGSLEPGNGLRGMRERLAQIGGSLDIVTGKGQGFALHVRLPVENAT